MNRKSRSFVYVCVLAGLLFGACDQSPILFQISLEVAPVDPMIPGGPTHIVEIEDTSSGDVSFYVASRFGSTVYRYYTPKNSSTGKYDTVGWSTIYLGGHILELATDGTNLYALTGEPVSSSNIWKYTPDTDPRNPSDPLPGWNPITPDVVGVGFIQTICGAGGKLFASTNTQLFMIDGNWTAIDGISNLLNGVAYLDSIYYFAVNTKGIYRLDTNTSSFLDDTDGNVVAIMPVGKRLVALYRDGLLRYSEEISGSSPVSFPSGNTGGGGNFSGSICLWEDPNDATSQLLLVGIEGSYRSTNHGYREIQLNTDGSLDTTTPGNLVLHTPGVSVDNTDRYYSTIGIHITTALHQAKDGRLFASTAKNGLWSYKERDGKMVWNAE